MSGQNPSRRSRRRSRPQVVRVEVHVVADPVHEARVPDPGEIPAAEESPAPTVSDTPAGPLPEQDWRVRRHTSVAVSDTGEPAPEPAAHEHLLGEVERRQIERRTLELRDLEEQLRERGEELTRQEDRVERRSGELEAAFAVREARIEQREAELADLEARLERKERELAAYVAQIQSKLASSY